MGIVLFGTVAASGVATLAKVDYSGSANLMIVAGALGIGLLPLVKPDVHAGFPDWFTVIFNSSISSTTIAAVLLNIVFHHLGRRKDSPAVTVG